MNWDNIGLLPIEDGGLTKTYGVKNSDGTIHKGVDFGWIDNPKCNIYAWQDGTVVDADNYKNGGERGEYVVIEHTYIDGKKRWSGYLHLLGNSLTVKVGDAVTMGQVIGKRGNTGKSNGAHLHLYLSEKTDKAYTYDTMKALCTFNPMSYLYIDKSLNTKLGTSLNSLKTMPEKIEYPSPVERDTTKNQILINHPNNWLRLRKEPNGEIYDEFCKNGIYNIYDKELKDGYTWYKIATVNHNVFWVAYSEQWAELLLLSGNNGNSIDEQINQLIKSIELLQNENQNLQTELASNQTRLKTVISTIDAIKKLLDY